MPLTNSFKELSVEITLVKIYSEKIQTACNAVYLRLFIDLMRLTHISYSRGIRWLPSPEACRMNNT